MVGLASLPDQLLASVAEYVGDIPSRLLLAVALSAPSSAPKWSSGNIDVCHLSSATKEVLMINNSGVVRYWERVDFGHLVVGVEEDEGESSDGDVSDELSVEDASNSEESNLDQRGKVLAGKLTDNDVGAVLVCIKLSGCELKRLGLGSLDITGSGLEPIRGSTSLEQLDLTKTCVHTADILLPILESIVDADGSALKHIPDIPGTSPSKSGPGSVSGKNSTGGSAILFKVDGPNVWHANETLKGAHLLKLAMNA